MTVDQRVVPAATPDPGLPPGRRPRLVALDAARGWLILFNLVAIAFASHPDASAQLSHPAWYGVTVFDLIFPTFVCLSGCGLALAYRRPVPVRVTARRVVVLLLFGLLYNAALDRTTDLSELRLTGPLQIYAVLTLLVALLTRVLGSTRAWAVFTIGWAAVLSVLMALYDRGCDLGQATRSCNLSAATDLRWLPEAMLYRGGAEGHDPEGLATTAGALITLSVGITVGRLLIDRTVPRVTATRMLGWAVTALVLGSLLGLLVEPYKRLWTPSFALLAAVPAVCALLLLWMLHDTRTTRDRASLDPRWVTPVVALGRNALLVYFGSHLVLHELAVRGAPPLLDRLLAVDWPWGHPVGTLAVVLVAAWTLLAYLLHRFGLYLRA